MITIPDGLKVETKQKKIILEELKKLKTHPTADEVFHIVRKKIPNISLGTVYRNLNRLADDGIIIKLGKAGEQKRFDGFTAKHHHFFCASCGRVYDLDLKYDQRISEVISDIKDHDVYDYDLEFYGKCKLCKKKENDNDKIKRNL